ncbi:aspartate/glutamate racemase family protein [Spartinivicinus poritis]|uniref:Aspartate/glutamate racemase family protein n=1 Tax=Spartinivicinus poritis TaxID=2994640 RepID=A0ABT5UCT7_9GAMM|nr:aspartate/glutamate racemase family protein [Spartinivicinus sp. A2-2]MDE1462899.1 aspartate/glutamate racemase family protein [Spartinivicinus sp. A2-2]
MQKILIIVPVNNTQFNQTIKRAVQPVIPPDFSVDILNINEGSDCIESRYDLVRNAPHVVNLATQAEQEGYSGLFITDMDMCGVEAVREVVNIPTIGGFRASAYTAMMLANKFSIITVMDSVVALQEQHIKEFGLVHNFASIRNVNVPVKHLGNEEIIFNKVLDAGRLAIINDGAQAIIFGCTGFVNMATRVSKALEDEGIRIPVIDPNCAAISYLVLLIRNQLLQSRKVYQRPINFT